MYVVELKRNGKRIYDGALALASQVWCMNHLFLDEPILFPYNCDPKIEIGEFQNARQEINQQYVDDHHIQVVRRDTGGGSVYCDRHGINFCFLADAATPDLYGNFAKMYRPGIEALQSMGVKNIEDSGRNDLTIDGKKISGGAMAIVNQRIYGGFSLLLDIDYESMVRSLTPNEKKLISKGIKSVKARVTDIRSHLADGYQDLSPEAFMHIMTKKIVGAKTDDDIKYYELTTADWKQIDALAAKKYKNWDWNYGAAPEYKYEHDTHLDSVGTVEIYVDVANGRMKDCSIYGDFFGKDDHQALLNTLIGTKMRREDLTDALKAVNLNDYINGLKAEQLVDLILGQSVPA
ncbi:MAG: lipoate--protein ligase [Lentilactobacillus buchneri]|jgi:lipoate-protein ligase A|nr:lipoate--protein ligase [Lentilactobacillus buchneri]MCI2028640.1 lipoate--protein ligase [Lentilactobacillus buchneri]